MAIFEYMIQRTVRSRQGLIRLLCLVCSYLYCELVSSLKGISNSQNRRDAEYQLIRYYSAWCGKAQEQDPETHLILNARRKGRALKEGVQQSDIGTSVSANEIISQFAANPRSIKMQVEMLGAAADFAYSQATKLSTIIFGAVPKAPRVDVIKLTTEIEEDTSYEQASQSDMGFLPGIKPDAGNARSEGNERRGQADTTETKRSGSAESRRNEKEPGENKAVTAGQSGDNNALMARANAAIEVCRDQAR